MSSEPRSGPHASSPRRPVGPRRLRAGLGQIAVSQIALGLIAVGLAACGGSSEPGNPPAQAIPAAKRPDIVVVLIDTLRPDYLEVGGGTRETAPFLKELAGRSVVFPRAISSSSWTAPSTATVFTGLYPPEHGVVQGFFAHERLAQAKGAKDDGDGDESMGDENLSLVPLPRSRKTLAEHLHEAGYQTFGVASNVNIGSELGFDRGFDRFSKTRQAPASELFATLLGWRGELAPDRPHFFYLHLNDVHKPYEGREPWYTPRADPHKDDAERYRSEIRYVDEGLRGLFAEMGWGPETATLVLSDHGESFGEHNMRGHGFSLHAEVNHVLMMLSAPGLPGGGRVVDRNVSLLDVLPTVLDLAGLDPTGLEGCSVVPLARGDEAARAAFDERVLFAHRLGDDGVLWAAVQGDWKLILDEVKGRQLLFDVAGDPRELENRLGREADVAKRLEQELERFKRTVRPVEDTSVQVPMDQALMEHLKSLGYVDGPSEEGD